MLTNPGQIKDQPLALIDWLKAIGSQLILLHHFSRYGAAADALAPVSGSIGAWLEWEARLAVQAFLVVGGFLAMRAFSLRGGPTGLADWLRQCRRRFLRLAVPLWVALAAAVLAAAVARGLSDHPSIPAAPGLLQGVAHLLMLQDILGQEALSAGIWYVAIDLQLFALLALLCWLPPAAAVLAGIALAAAALFGFNRDAAWEPWAPYFFGSYALGAAVWLAVARLTVRHGAMLVAAAGGLVAAALWVAWRDSLVVAAASAGLLLIGLRSGRAVRPPPAVRWLAAISYGVLLLHYPAYLVADAVAEAWMPGQVSGAVAAVVAAWGLTLILADRLTARFER